MQRFLLLACGFLLVSCVVTVRHIAITPVEPGEDAELPITVDLPVKAHLNDGSTIMFPKGVTVDEDSVNGEGFKYDITLENSEPVTEVDLQDLAAMESYQDVVNTGATVAASTVTTVGGGMAGVMLFKAVFGSCPTTYSLDGEIPVLEAESFSYSIAPGFEARDVDRLGITDTGQSAIELEIRNEALETHYIDQVELLELVHGKDESVYPDHKGRPVVVADLRAPNHAVDRSGRRVDEIVAAADGNAWRSTTEQLRQVSAEDMEEYVDLEFNNPNAADEVALVLRLRNSLLNTVLLYDVMLSGQGYRALDWMGGDLDRLWPKFQLARWYQQKMGMRISVWERGRYRNVATLADTGPIAWNEVAISLPAPKQSKTIKVRLSFIADNWRIDQVALATKTRRGQPRVIPVSAVHSASGHQHPQAESNLRAADDTYVVTKPAEYLRMRFDIGNPEDNLQRTWFLAAEGYYIEWMRKEWLETTSAATFTPNDEALLTALTLWESRRDELRQQFESTKIPVR